MKKTLKPIIWLKDNNEHEVLKRVKINAPYLRLGIWDTNINEYKNKRVMVKGDLKNDAYYVEVRDLQNEGKESDTDED